MRFLIVFLAGAFSVLLASRVAAWVSRRYGPEKPVFQLSDHARAVIARSPQAVVSMASDGQILDFNPAAEQLFGYPRQEVIGAHLDQLLIPDEEDRELHRRGLERYVSTGESRILNQTIPLEALTRSKARVPVELVATATRIEGEVVIVGFLRDLTERRRAEEHLRRAREAAEEASRLKSEFLANMSHEIRTPLNAILGYSALLAEPETEEAIRPEWSRVVRANGRHLLELLDGILDLSKIEAGALEVRCEAFEVDQLLREIGRMTAPRAEEKGLAFSIQVGVGVPKALEGDSLRARQILINLVSNALKFTDDGEVRIIVERLDAESILFAVEDSGPGIAPHSRDRVFEPFTRVRRPGASRKPGAGLGLDLSLRLANLLGGSLKLGDRPCGGCRFELRLPMIECATETLPVGELDRGPMRQVLAVAPDLEPRFDGRKFLVAEDSVVSQQLLEYHLKKWGADVECVDDGLAATQRILDEPARGWTYDCVMMDMQMPELDGYEATRQLRSAGFDAPIVGVTADAFEEDRARCLAAGCTAFVAKPIDAALLRRDLATLLNVATDTGASHSPRAESRSERFAALVDRYRKSLSSTRLELEAAVVANDTDEACRLLHQLKGAAGGYGDHALSECASRANAALRSGVPLADAWDLLDEVMAELEASADRKGQSTFDVKADGGD